MELPDRQLKARGFQPMEDRPLKTSSLSLTMALLVAGCAAVGPFEPSGSAASSHPGTNYFDYRIEPTIAGRYGITSEVAWLGIGAERPSMLLLGEQSVTFQPGTTAADIDRFAAAFDAVVQGPQVTPGTPDGAIPPKATNTYRVTFRTESVSLASLDALVETTRIISGGWLFSSEAAAKTLLQMLRVKQQATQYKVAFIGFNMAMCVPEDCGPDGLAVPTYPSTEPLPTPTPTATPVTAPMELKSVACLRSGIPLGKQGILRVTGILSASCRAVHEVKASVDDERREVRLEATEKPLMEGCQTAVSYPEVEVPFYPARLGTYRIMADVDGQGEKALCEVEVVEHQ
jgi:hypothetical protein